MLTAHLGKIKINSHQISAKKFVLRKLETENHMGEVNLPSPFFRNRVNSTNWNSMVMLIFAGFDQKSPF